MADIKGIKRTADGKLPAIAWPGGYPIIYVDGQGSLICADCATKSLDDKDEVEGFKPEAFDIYYEGPALNCDQCNTVIESAYGDPGPVDQPNHMEGK